MEQGSKKESRVPPSPALVAPLGASVVDGSEVTFEWRPVDGATEYRLQVAPSTTFDTPTIDETVRDATKLTVADVFPTDEQTFFWRVLAKTEGGWSRGDRVESFVSATPEEADAINNVPDAEENLGPVTELVRSASTTVATTLQSAPGRFEQEKQQGVAYEGVPAGQILAISMTIIMAIGAVVVILFMWTSTVSKVVRSTSAGGGDYPDLRETETQAIQKLSQYEVIDAEERVYRIPIDQAMDIMANQAYQQKDQAYSPEAPFVRRQP